jgi:hypothetical protein
VHADVVPWPVEVRSITVCQFLSIPSKASCTTGFSLKYVPHMPNLGFDLGHGPVSDPTIRRHHAIGHPPFFAPPGAVPVNPGVRPSRGADPPMHPRMRSIDECSGNQARPPKQMLATVLRAPGANQVDDRVVKVSAIRSGLPFHHWS